MEVGSATQQRIASTFVSLACLAAAFLFPFAPDAQAWPDGLVDLTEAAVEDPADADDEPSDDDSSINLREQFIDALNELRAEHDLAPLRPMASMHHAARAWTESMVEASRLSHADVIYDGLGDNWKFAGENVGRGPTVESLMEAFMASETHRANILDSRFTHVGVATMVHDDDERIYTTHRFAQFERLRRGARQARV